MLQHMEVKRSENWNNNVEQHYFQVSLMSSLC